MKTKTCGECKYYQPESKRCDLRKIICNIQPTDTGCACFEQKPIPKLTNGDKIRQMSNEELAELFALSCMCDTCPLKDVECVGDGETARTYAHCYDKFNAYLNAPAESEGEDETE